jgi:acyl-CoA dehydrogenase
MIRLLEEFDKTTPCSDAELEYIQYVRQIALEKIAPRANEFDSSGVFPWANIEVLNGIGLNESIVPASHGGAPLSFSAILRVIEEISRACPSTAITWATTMHAVEPLLEFGTDDQKARFLPRIVAGKLGAIAITEASGGSDVLAMQSTLVPDGNDFRLNGNKVFITNGDVADLILVFALWPHAAQRRDQLTCVLVDPSQDGFEVVRCESKLGHRASSTAELRLSDCRISASNVLGAPGDGFKVLLYMLNKSRPSIAAQALGIAGAAFEETLEYINNRRQFGRRILDFQGVQFIVADMASRLVVAKSYLRHIGVLVDSGANQFDIEASILKVVASDAAMHIATAAMQLQGGHGYMSGSTVERLFRDAKLTQIWEGANELHRGRIGKSFLQSEDTSRI